MAWVGRRARGGGPTTRAPGRADATRAWSMCAVAENKTIGTRSPTSSRTRPMIVSELSSLPRLTSSMTMEKGSCAVDSAANTASMLGTRCTSNCIGVPFARYVSFVERKSSAIAERSNALSSAQSTLSFAPVRDSGSTSIWPRTARPEFGARCGVSRGISRPTSQ
jgi:hypothetical protein